MEQVGGCRVWRLEPDGPEPGSTTLEELPPQDGEGLPFVLSLEKLVFDGLAGFAQVERNGAAGVTRRSGNPTADGVRIGIPVVAGPALAVLAQEHARYGQPQPTPPAQPGPVFAGRRCAVLSH
jgi:hypothetical protein